MLELSTEQQFSLTIFERKVEEMSTPEVKRELVALYVLMMHKENYFKAAIKQKMGIEAPNLGG